MDYKYKLGNKFFLVIATPMSHHDLPIFFVTSQQENGNNELKNNEQNLFPVTIVDNNIDANLFCDTQQCYQTIQQITQQQQNIYENTSELNMKRRNPTENLLMTTASVLYSSSASASPKPIKHTKHNIFNTKSGTKSEATSPKLNIEIKKDDLSSVISTSTSAPSNLLDLL